MSKDTTILSDLRDFFSENENNRAINSIMRVMEHINIRSSQIGAEKKENCTNLVFKYQSVHFSAQIASFTLTLMQYNILCTVKRFESYETIGALFADATDESLELSVTDKIWELILDTILEIAELVSADACELISALVDDNPKFHKLYRMYNLNVA